MCEMEMDLVKFKKHIELCKKKAELHKTIHHLDSEISGMVLQAFIKAQTLQMNLNVEM